MPSVGALLWISCRPLFKMVICTSSGFILSKLDLFSNVAARGAGQVLLNITIPSLMFSKMVPAFTPQNIGALGPLVSIGIIYHVMGLIIGWTVKELFWVPHRFRTGIVAAGIWGNYGDIPIAVIMSITASAPFGPGDSDLGVAYIAAFILVFFITLFPLGGHRLISHDFEGPPKEDEEVQEELKMRHRKIIESLESCFRRSKRRSEGNEEDIEGRAGESDKVNSTEDASRCVSNTGAMTTITEVVEEGTYPRLKRVSFDPLSHIHHLHRTPTDGQYEESPVSPVSPMSKDIMSPTPTMVATTEKDFGKEPKENTTRSQTNEAGSASRDTTPFMTKIARFTRSFFTPASLSIIIGFVISLIKPLKGLFVNFDGSPIPNAPDGHPPLYFLYDTASFLGAASVPLGLVCLGSALASLKVPKNLKELPLGAISGLAIGKLVISPIIGVLLVNGFVKVGFIHEEDKVLRFVCMFFACMPTATTQVFLTQVYSGTGEAEHLSAFLIPQYALMFISSTALTAYSLHVLF